MRKNSTRSMGAFHPVLFFMLIYGISLFLAIFVCRTVYYSMNGEEASVDTEKLPATQANLNATAYK